MFNLYSQLTTEDKDKIEQYIYNYGILKDYYLGTEKWLQYWSTEKIKLYKLLDSQFILKIPFSYNKDKKDIERDIDALIYCNNEYGKFITLIKQIVRNLPNADLYNNDFYELVCDMLHIDSLAENITHTYISKKVTFKAEGAKRELQLQPKGKPVKMLGKVITYLIDNNVIKSEEEKKYFADNLEGFRIRHSQILNEKTINGNLCFSVHPLDFMTMSDNNTWNSCMNWRNGGCYHVGSVEMLNSNNVVCCYLESSRPFYLTKEQNNDYTWNDKKWRQLFYVTKDIIVSGKSYPYPNKEITMAALNALRDLAKKNLNWTYEFGPEQYLDMLHVRSLRAMENNQRFISTKKTTKHNILFHTKGMYNDMLNDQRTKYYCVRNKVDHNKVITYSGKAPCLCCGESVISESDYYSDEYNERYENVGEVICYSCNKEHFSCNVCHETRSNSRMYRVNEDGHVRQYCEYCFNEYIRVCPCCGKVLNLRDALQDIKRVYIIKPDCKTITLRNLTQNEYTDDSKIYPVLLCPECCKNIEKNHEIIELDISSGTWIVDSGERFLIKAKDDAEFEDLKKYNRHMLQKYQCDNNTVIENTLEPIRRRNFVLEYSNSIDKVYSFVIKRNVERSRDYFINLDTGESRYDEYCHYDANTIEWHTISF